MQVLMSGREWREFPDCPKEFPNELLNEDWAYTIHSQSLEKLNSRGGLHPTEIVLNRNKITSKEYSNSEPLHDTEIAIRRIKQYILNHNNKIK